MSSIEVREIKEEYAHPQSGMMSKLQLAESMCTKSIIPYDSFGPEKVIVVKEPRSDLLGFLVTDSTAPGPGKGELRMATDVTVDDVFRLRG